MNTSEGIKPSRHGLFDHSDCPDRTAEDPSRENWRGLAVLLSLLCCLFVLFWLCHYPVGHTSPTAPSTDNSFSELPDPAENPAQVTVFRAENAYALISELKKNHLWEIKAGSAIAPLLLASYPTDLETLAVRDKKKAFLNSLLPAALVTNAEISRERETLLAILDKIPLPTATLTFSGLRKDWQPYINQEEIGFLKGLARKYRTKRAEELLKRVNIIPVSLILAQGALESSWGTSRFTKEGNSLFGLWTWRGNGIIPLQREEGKKHRVEAYDSILASLQKYTLTLNRLDAYSDFRSIRTRSLDPFQLVDGLQLYSERGIEYVNDIKRVISNNGLTEFDEVRFPDTLITMLPSANSLLTTDKIAQL